MICRMSKEQREALQELIDASVQHGIVRDNHNAIRRFNAECDFLALFANESRSEDLHKQDKTSDLYVS